MMAEDIASRIARLLMTCSSGSSGQTTPLLTVALPEEPCNSGSLGSGTAFPASATTGAAISCTVAALSVEAFAFARDLLRLLLSGG